MRPRSSGVWLLLLGPTLCSGCLKFELAGQNPQYVGKVLDIVPQQLCFVVGTIFAEMSLKPSILREISERNKLPPEPRQKYLSENDEYILEDESGRLILLGNSPRERGLVTGTSSLIVLGFI